MPPKASSAVWPPRRTTRSTARKSVPQPSQPVSARAKSTTPQRSGAGGNAIPDVPSQASDTATPKSTPSTSPRKEKTASATGIASAVATPKSSPLTSPQKEKAARKSTITTATTTPLPPPLTPYAIEKSTADPGTELAADEDQATAKMPLNSDSETIWDQTSTNRDTGVTEKLGSEKLPVERVQSAEMALTAYSGDVPSEKSPKLGAEKTRELCAVESRTEAESRTEPTTASGQESIQQGGTRQVTKTVVKKTVRIVKKLVKKRVPKRLLKDPGLSANPEAEEKPKTADKKEAADESERCDSDVSGEVRVRESEHIASTSTDVEKADCNDSFSMEIENSKFNVTEEAQKPNHANEVPMEVEISECSVNVPVEGETVDSKRGCVEPMEIEKPTLEVDVSGEGKHSKKSSVDEREKDASGYGVLLEAPFLEFDGANEEVEVERTPSVDDTPLEGQTAGFVDYQNELMLEDKNAGVEGEKVLSIDNARLQIQTAGVVENRNEVILADQYLGSVKDQNVETSKNQNQNVETVKDQIGEDKVEDHSANLGEDQSDEYKVESVEPRSGEVDKGVKEGLDNNENGNLKAEVGLGDGILLSAEMEALERRRRRKTELFVGGLGKECKEEDVRKFFEEIGEVVEVRLVINGKTGKNKGFAFVRYASAMDAKKALEKHQKVEICGKQCGISLVEGNDTIFLGNIDKKWKSEDVIKLLQQVGIERIDKVTVKADPNKTGFNRGFAFLELETCKDAQIAFNKLQKKDVFGKHLKVKVAWADPLIEPDEEEMLKVKSVYAEYLPSSWDEENVKDYFRKFGEIENVVLSRNLHSSKRKDFAFVNYKTREAALACIKAFSHEQLDDGGSKVKVSLAKPISKGKQIRYVSKPIAKEISKDKQKISQSVLKPNKQTNKELSIGTSYGDIKVDRRSSTTAELVQLLREQASWRPTQTPLGTGSVDQNFPYPSPGMKRPFPVLGDDLSYSDPRRYPRLRMESSYPIASPRSMLSQGIGMTSLPHYNRQGAGYTPEYFHGVEDYPSHVQTRERAPYHGSSGIYRRY